MKGINVKVTKHILTACVVGTVVVAGLAANAAYTVDQTNQTKKAQAAALVAAQQKNQAVLEKAVLVDWGNKNYVQCTRGYAAWQALPAFTRAKIPAPICKATSTK